MGIADAEYRSALLPSVINGDYSVGSRNHIAISDESVFVQLAGPVFPNIHKLDQGHAQPFRKTVKGLDGGVALPALQLAEGSGIDATAAG